MTSQVRKIYSRKFIHCVDVRLIVFIILGRLSKGEYSGLSNEEKCKLYRGKRSEQNKKNNVLCEKLQRVKLKENRITQDSVRSANDTANYKQRNRAAEVEEVDQCSSSPDSSFSNKQTLHRSLSSADNYLPKRPHKMAEVIEKLVEKYHVKIP